MGRAEVSDSFGAEVGDPLGQRHPEEVELPLCEEVAPRGARCPKVEVLALGP